MAEYLVIKREKCDVSEFHFDNCNCGGTGYIETQVPLLDVLRHIYVPMSGVGLPGPVEPFRNAEIIE